MNAQMPQQDLSDGSALAAFLAAAIGAFALGLLVVLSEAGLFAVPAVYAPAGGLSGRTTAAMFAWLLSWGILHARWRNRRVAQRGVFIAFVVLVTLSVLMTFPPVWGLLPAGA
jgi:FtsH-binding integral membrane protein